MMIEDVINFNPWWEGREDYHVKLWRCQKYKWRPQWIDDISLEPFSLNFILGPRQVGKTTGIKLLISELLRELEPEKILYINCEVFPDFISLRKLLEEFIRHEKEPLIFLDEVTTLAEWWKAVKPLIDTGQLEDAVITITGSSALKIRRDMEFFPGRKGKGKTIEVLPLNFKDFVEIHGIKRFWLHYDEVLRLFNRYIKIGGFPGSINEIPPEEILGAYLGEFVRFGKSFQIMKEVFASIMSTIPSATSFRALANKTSGYSYKVVQDYLEFLRNLYLIEFAYLKEGSKILYKREKKIFFRDPLLLRLFSMWSGIRPVESAIYENIVQDHLYRKFGEVYYYRNKYEIDAVAGDLRIEVKAGKAHRRYPRNVTVLEREDIPRFLIELFS